MSEMHLRRKSVISLERVAHLMAAECFLSGYPNGSLDRSFMVDQLSPPQLV